jgi:hypothetical protein
MLCSVGLAAIPEGAVCYSGVAWPLTRCWLSSLQLSHDLQSSSYCQSFLCMLLFVFREATETFVTYYILHITYYAVLQPHTTTSYVLSLTWSRALLCGASHCVCHVGTDTLLWRLYFPYYAVLQPGCMAYNHIICGVS